MAILKDAIGNAPALKLVDNCDGAGEIVVVVNVSLEGWWAILNQQAKDKDWHLCCDQCGPWKTAKNCSEHVKLECHGLIMALMKSHNYIYVVRFLVGTDANRFVQPLTLPANDLAAALVICAIAGVQLVHFDMKYVPGRLNECQNGLSV